MVPTIHVDYREKSLIELLEDIPLVSSNLDCGDIVFKSDDKEELIIERKSIGDLNSSISDGRYIEQKKRLCANYSRNRIIYLVEGDLINLGSRIDSKKVWSSILHTTFRDGLYVYRAQSLAESAEFIRQLWKRFSEKTSDWLLFLNQDKVDYAIQSSNKISTKKKENNTPKNVYINMLSQITGVSVKMATVIVENFPNMKSLLESLENTGIESLSNIKIGNRKLGNVCSQRIYDSLLS